MKKKSKKIMLLLAVLTVSIIMLPIDASAQSQDVIPPVSITSLQNSLLDAAYPNANIIGWRYKSENGKMYRRQYNYSREKWIGEWELC